MNLSIVIPAFNEEATISRVIQELKAIEWAGLENEIIVIDDGSRDQTGEIARSTGVLVIQHLINRGVGGATWTGIEAALRRGADLIVTCDADGQHSSADIQKVADPIIKNNTDVVIGSRMLDSSAMPRIRRIANLLANYLTFLLSGVKTTDSQSGFRAYSRSAAKRIKVLAGQYEANSQVFEEIKRHNLKFTEVSVKTIYTNYSLSKGQGFRVGLKTLFNLLLSKYLR